MVKEYHEDIKHRDDLIEKDTEHWLITPVSNFADKMGENILPHLLHLSLALLIPIVVGLFVIFASGSVITTELVLLLAVFVQGWIQWWSLPALQRLQVKADIKRDAKADVDHQSLVAIRNKQDEIEAKQDTLFKENGRTQLKLNKIISQLNHIMGENNTPHMTEDELRDLLKNLLKNISEKNGR